MKDLLVVIDMVNGFVNEGALADKNIKRIIPNIENLIIRAKENNDLLVAFKDCHTINDEEFKIFPPHCIKGTTESEIVDELKIYEKDMIVIEKNTTNGFITNEFKNLIDNNVYNNVYVCGCCTDICVQNFVESYLKHIKENSLDTKIIVIENACYTFLSQNHNALDEHKKSINYMKSLGAKII